MGKKIKNKTKSKVNTKYNFKKIKRGNYKEKFNLDFVDDLSFEERCDEAFDFISHTKRYKKTYRVSNISNRNIKSVRKSFNISDENEFYKLLFKKNGQNGVVRFIDKLRFVSTYGLLKLLKVDFSKFDKKIEKVEVESERWYIGTLYAMGLLELVDDTNRYNTHPSSKLLKASESNKKFIPNKVFDKYKKGVALSYIIKGGSSLTCLYKNIENLKYTFDSIIKKAYQGLSNYSIEQKLNVILPKFLSGQKNKVTLNTLLFILGKSKIQEWIHYGDKININNKDDKDKFNKKRDNNLKLLSDYITKIDSKNQKTNIGFIPKDIKLLKDEFIDLYFAPIILELEQNKQENAGYIEQIENIKKLLKGEILELPNKIFYIKKDEKKKMEHIKIPKFLVTKKEEKEKLTNKNIPDKLELNKENVAQSKFPSGISFKSNNSGDKLLFPSKIPFSSDKFLMEKNVDENIRHNFISNLGGGFTLNSQNSNYSFFNTDNKFNLILPQNFFLNDYVKK